MADEYRINYVLQLNAFREIKINTPGLTPSMIAVYYALLDMNNQSKWSEEFDVDFGYMMALSKVDKTTYYKAMDFFLQHGLLDRYTKGVNLYSRAKAVLSLLYEKSTGKPLGNSDGMSIGNTLGNSESEQNNIETIKAKPKKEIINIPFDDFWNLYPVKKGRTAAEKKWLNLTDANRDKIINTLPAFIKHKPFDSYNHPYPSTYLNQERWDDILTMTPLNGKTQTPKRIVIDHSKL